MTSLAQTNCGLSKFTRMPLWLRLKYFPITFTIIYLVPCYLKQGITQTEQPITIFRPLLEEAYHLYLEYRL